MSSRTVPRFALTALFAAALAAPAAAQEGGFQVPLNSDPVIPLPLEKALPAAPMPRAKIQIPPLGPVGLALDVKMPERTPNDNTQVFNFSVGLFGSDSSPVPPQPAPMTPPNAPGAFVIGTCGLQRVMPMPEPPRFLVAPTPVPTGSFVIGVGQPVANSFTIGLCGPGTVCAQTCEVCPSCPKSVAANPLSGTWYRDTGMALIAITFAGDEITVRGSQREGNQTVILTLTAHYAVAKDGLVYGAITSADVDVKLVGKPDPGIGLELAEMSMMLQDLTDRPFSFRTKHTSAGLVISQLKAEPFEGIGGKDVLFCGLYKCAKDGKVPEPKPLNIPGRVLAEPEVTVGAPVRPTTGALVGNACDKVERIGIDFNAPLPTMGQPIPPGGTFVPPPAVPAPGPIPSSARPVSCPPQADAMKQMAADAFIQMAQAREPIATVPAPPGIPHAARPISCAEPAGAMKQMAQDAFLQMVQEKERRRGGTTLPSPRYLEHYPQYFPPDPAFPLPRELACQEAADVLRATGCGSDPCAPERYKNVATCATVTPLAQKPGLVGTWVREVGSKRCVVKLAPDHFTATVSSAQEFDGKTATAHLTWTVDYHLTRDGLTAVGLVTSVDMKFDGDPPDEQVEGVMEQVGALQKLLEDTPIALTLRVYGDALVIGNVRMQTVGGLLDCEPSAYIGGRYRAVGDKPLPALKAVKSGAPKPLPVYGPPIVCPPGGFGPGVYGIPALPPGAFCPPGLPQGFCAPAVPSGLVYPPGSGFPPSAPTGDLLPPQHLGQPLTPVPTPTVVLPPIPLVEATPSAASIQVIQGLTIPEPVPSMTAPTAPVPTMPEPVAPTVSVEEPKAVPATEMTVVWNQKIAPLPDPTKNGAPGNGIAGQLFLCGRTNQFARANGTLTVDLVDETPRPAGQRAATPERWVFDKDTLRNLQTTDETFGKSYVLFLPWPGDHSDVTSVKLTVRYDPESGDALHAVPTTVTFERSAAPVPTMPEPVPPGKVGSVKSGKKQKYVSDSNVRIQQLLYQSEDLRQIQNEWRRFWFNDPPSHLTPERIHGDIR